MFLRDLWSSFCVPFTQRPTSFRIRGISSAMFMALLLVSRANVRTDGFYKVFVDSYLSLDGGDTTYCFRFFP